MLDVGSERIEALTIRSEPLQTATDWIQPASEPLTAAWLSLLGCASFKLKAGFFLSCDQSDSVPSFEPVTHSVPVMYLQISQLQT